MKLTKIQQRENCRYVDFTDPSPVWWRSCKERLRISRNNLYWEKLESLTYISAAGSMGLCLLIFTQLFSKVKRSESRSADRKRILTWNSHSRSFYVIHFAISFSHRPTRGSISSYNIAGFISEVSEEVATQIAKNCRREQPHSHLRPPPRGIPAFRNQSHWPTFLSLIVWVCLHSNLCSGLQKTHLFCNRVRFGRSGSSKVDDFGTNRKSVCDFLLVRHCDCGPILYHFWDTATYWLKIACFPTSVSFGALAPCFLKNFALKLTVRKLESWSYPQVKTACMIVAGVCKWTLPVR